MKSGHAINKILRISILLIVITGFFYLIFIPPYHPITGKQMAAELVALASPVKVEIAQAIAERKPISQIDWRNIKTQGKYLSYMYITETGEIFTFSEKAGTFIMFTPLYKIGELILLCTGQPKKNQPAACR